MTRAAVIGVGFIGVAHVEALRRLGVEVVGVAGSTPERARRQAAARNLPPAYDSVAHLLADDRVDVVHVTSPNARHREHVLAALDAGKHVVCEKPLAIDSTEGVELVGRAAAAGVVAAVCFNIRFYPLCHQMRAMVAAGEIGSPRFVTGSYLQDWLLLDTDWNWRLDPTAGGALRSVADIGSHWLDLAAFVSGQQVSEVMADLHTFLPTRRHPAGPVETFAAAADAASVDQELVEELVEERMTTDDGAGILLRFADGARGTLAVSQVAAGHKNSVSLEVDGSDAALAWRSEDPEQLWIGHRGRPNELLQRDPALLAAAARRLAAYPGGHVEGFPDTFRALFAEIYADVDRGTASDSPTYPTFADGLDALRVTDAVARSAAERSWVSVSRE